MTAARGRGGAGSLGAAGSSPIADVGFALFCTAQFPGLSIHVVIT